jgi:hypothetical protein
LVVSHFLSDRNGKGDARAVKGSKLFSKKPIKAVKVEMECVSLKYFIDEIAMWKSDSSDASTASPSPGEQNTLLIFHIVN